MPRVGCAEPGDFLRARINAAWSYFKGSMTKHFFYVAAECGELTDMTYDVCTEVWSGNSVRLDRIKQILIMKR